MLQLTSIFFFSKNGFKSFVTKRHFSKDCLVNPLPDGKIFSLVQIEMLLKTLNLSSIG